MYTFNFIFDNTVNDIGCSHIERVCFHNGSTDVVVQKEEILTFQFPTKYTLYLFSDKTTYAVNTSNLICLKIVKES